MPVWKDSSFPSHWWVLLCWLEHIAIGDRIGVDNNLILTFIIGRFPWAQLMAFIIGCWLSSFHYVQWQTIFYSHHGIYVVSWVPFSSLMEFLSFDNDFHQYSLIRETFLCVIFILCVQTSYLALCSLKLCPKKSNQNKFFFLSCACYWGMP